MARKLRNRTTTMKEKRQTVFSINSSNYVYATKKQMMYTGENKNTRPTQPIDIVIRPVPHEKQQSEFGRRVDCIMYVFPHNAHTNVAAI